MFFVGCGKKRSDPNFAASGSLETEALAEVLANDMASGNIDDWEQYLLKGIEARESTGQEQLGFFPSGDDYSYFRKKREADSEDEAGGRGAEEQ